MTHIWDLLKKYVRDTEIANSVHFTNEAWDRVKQLEKDIHAYIFQCEEQDKAAFQKQFEAERQRANKAESALDDLRHDVGVFAFCGLNFGKDDSESLRSDDSLELCTTIEMVRGQQIQERFELRESRERADALQSHLVAIRDLVLQANDQITADYGPASVSGAEGIAQAVKARMEQSAQYRALLIETFPLIKDMAIAMKYGDVLETHVTMGGAMPRVEKP